MNLAKLSLPLNNMLKGDQNGILKKNMGKITQKHLNLKKMVFHKYQKSKT
jgi:hypothetical protein